MRSGGTGDLAEARPCPGADLRDLLAHREGDSRAAEAVDLFCYRVKTRIGALGRLDSLVFSGGIGENSPEVRRLACEGLEFLGIDLDEGRNVAGGPLISTPSGQVRVRVIRTDEETVIAGEAIRPGVGPSIESLPSEPAAVMSQGVDRWTRR